MSVLRANIMERNIRGIDNRSGCKCDLESLRRENLFAKKQTSHFSRKILSRLWFQHKDDTFLYDGRPLLSAVFRTITTNTAFR